MDQYDYQTLEINETSEKEIYRFAYKEVIEPIRKVKQIYGNSDWFKHEKDKSFQTSISTIYKTFNGVDLFSGTSLKKNEILFDQFGRKRMAGNALVSLSLMVAVSRPEEKEIMTKAVVNLINRKN